MKFSHILLIQLIFVCQFLPQTDSLETQIKSETGLQTLGNNLFSSSDWDRYEHSIIGLCVVYWILITATSASGDKRARKWLSIARVFPTYELWKNSLAEGDPKLYSICRDFPDGLTRGVTEKYGTTDRDLSLCYNEMLKIVDDDPLHSTNQGYFIRAAIPSVALILKVMAGFYTLYLAFNIASERLSEDKIGPHTDTSLRQIVGYNEYHQKENNFLLHLTINVYSNDNLNLISAFKKHHEFFLDSLHQSMGSCNTTDNYILTLGYQGTIQSTLDDQNELILNTILPNDCISQTLNEATFKSSLQGYLQTFISPYIQIERISYQKDVQFKPERVSSRDEDNCGPLYGSLSNSQSAGYENSVKHLLCSNSFGSVCEVQCQFGYITGDRWGKLAICGFGENFVETDLAWLPNGFAYQELCAPDPVQRVSNLLVRLSAENLIYQGKWKNFGTSGSDFICSGNCFSYDQNQSNRDLIILKTLPKTKKRVFSFSGVSSSLSTTQTFTAPLQSGVTIIAVLGAMGDSLRTSFLRFQNLVNLNIMSLMPYLPTSYLNDNELFVLTIQAKCEILATDDKKCKPTRSMRINGFEIVNVFPTTDMLITDFTSYNLKSTDPQQWRVGQMAGDKKMVGALAELAIYSQTLPAEETLQIEQFLGAKWGFRSSVMPNKPPTPNSATSVAEGDLKKVSVTFDSHGQIYDSNEYRSQICCADFITSCTDIPKGSTSLEFLAPSGCASVYIRAQVGKLESGAPYYSQNFRPPVKSCVSLNTPSCWVESERKSVT